MASRFFLNYHTKSQIFWGAILGLFCGLISNFQYLNDNRRNNFNKFDVFIRVSLAILPIVLNKDITSLVYVINPEFIFPIIKFFLYLIKKLRNRLVLIKI